MYHTILIKIYNGYIGHTINIHLVSTHTYNIKNKYKLNYHY